MTQDLLHRLVGILRALLVSVLVAGMIFYVVRSIHWPLLVDSPIMHYVQFLMDHGLHPYAEITDNNMPGAYLTEGWAMSIFGGGDLGWRTYDFFLLGVLTLAMVVIARPYDWLAGFYAGGFFTLLHASEGPNYAGEREQVMTALFFVAYAFLFTAIRRRSPWCVSFFGLAAGMAGAIKPTTVPLIFLLLVFAAIVLRRREERMAPYVAWGLAGIAAAAALNIDFLVRHNAVKPFLFVLLKITPAYVALHHPGVLGMLRQSFPLNMFLLLGIGVVLAVTLRAWNWERWALLLGAATGLFSFVIQHKGFLHHRYMFLSFVLLLLTLEFTRSLARPGTPRLLGAAAVLATLILSVPHYVLRLRDSIDGSDLTTALQQDLQHLGGSQLQGQVQCFDLVYGCINALYHLGLVENTGYTGDLLLFSPTDNVGTRYYRDMFWRLDREHPASVYVMTNQWFGGRNTFDKINTWPSFAEHLAKNYTLVTSREFPNEGTTGPVANPSEDPPAYRIFVRNGAALGPRPGSF